MDIKNMNYRFNQNIMIRKRNETILAYNPDNCDMYEMNDIAGEIIFWMKDAIPIQEILDMLLKEYDAQEEVILPDVIALLERFIDLGIIEVTE